MAVTGHREREGDGLISVTAREAGFSSEIHSVTLRLVLGCRTIPAQPKTWLNGALADC